MVTYILISYFKDAPKRTKKDDVIDKDDNNQSDKENVKEKKTRSQRAAVKKEIGEIKDAITDKKDTKKRAIRKTAKVEDVLVAANGADDKGSKARGKGKGKVAAETKTVKKSTSGVKVKSSIKKKAKKVKEEKEEEKKKDEAKEMKSLPKVLSW